MKFTKQKLADMNFCYAVSFMEIDGKPGYIYAPDAPGPCYFFDAETFERQTVWEEPGGTMSIVSLPGRANEFLAVQQFNPGFEAKEARIVHVVKERETWSVSTFMELPYVHRFDILERSGVYYLIFCTVASWKDSIEDWSHPGSIYVAELPDDFSQPVELTVIAEGMHRNHGYWKIQNDGFTSGYTSCDEGIYEVIPPESRGGEWSVTRIVDAMVSDIALCDIDGDGVDEIAAIKPFHGNDFVVYKNRGGVWSPVYRYPGKTNFLHVVWGGILCGEPVFIGGCRELDRELFILQWRNGEITESVIEKGAGPSNVKVIKRNGKEILAVANREIGECAFFTVEPDNGQGN